MVYRRLLYFAIGLLLTSRPAVMANTVVAFPGAEGFGAGSVGGRGGQVYEVTHLGDSGPGSLRACVEAKGPRTCVFHVGGTILVRSKLKINNPYITIAGQTAPGGGITLQNAPDYGGMTLAIRTHDVIIRYMRIRPGSHPQETGNIDAIGIGHSGKNVEAHKVIVDHTSLSWGTDETVSIWYASHDITIQWSIISEALYCSTHIDTDPTENCHSMGMLIGSKGAAKISVHHNLFAHNNARNPQVNTVGVVDIVNNVIYNPGRQASWGPSHVTSHYTTSEPVNFVGNYHKRGPSTGPARYSVSVSKSAAVFLQGNISPSRPHDNLKEALVVRPKDRKWIVPTRHPAPPVTTTSAGMAYTKVLSDAGASRILTETGQLSSRRDPVDLRVVNDVIQGTGKIIDEPREVGGWPALAPGIAPKDSDHDGMTDAWEKLFGFDPLDPNDGRQDADGDGYTNLEEYLNGTNPFRRN